MGKNRFTINNDDDGGIIISKSLMEQMVKKQTPATSSAAKDADGVPKTTKPAMATEEIPFVQKSAVSGHHANVSPSPPITPEGFPSMYPNLQMPQTPPPPPQPSFGFPNVGQSTMPSPSTPAGGPTPLPFDPNYMLVELRNEYERKLQQYQTMWRRNLEEMDRLNRDLIRKNRELFRTEVKRVENIGFFKRDDTGKTSAAPLEAPCREMESNLAKCYQENGQTSLQCGSLVHEFAKCIDQARLAALKQNQNDGNKKSSSVSI